MRIGIDIDDTIADTYEVAFAYAQKYTINELGRSGKIQNATSNHHTYLKNMHNWNHEEEMNFFDKYYGEMLQAIRPFTFAVNTIKQLKKEGNEIIIVTARWTKANFDVKDTTLKWLKDNNIPYDEIILNADDKAKVALEKKLDLFIDDSFKNCLDVVNSGIKTYMMNTRTNQGLQDERITRVFSWSDIYNRIKKEENS